MGGDSLNWAPKEQIQHGQQDSRAKAAGRKGPGLPTAAASSRDQRGGGAGSARGCRKKSQPGVGCAACARKMMKWGARREQPAALELEQDILVADAG